MKKPKQIIERHGVRKSTLLRPKFGSSGVSNSLVVKLMSVEPRGKNYSSECKEKLLSDKKASKSQVKKKTNKKYFKLSLASLLALFLLVW